MYESPEALRAAYAAGERPKLNFHPHALERGVEMARQLKLDPAEIREAMFDPFTIGWSNKYRAVLLNRTRCTLSVCVDRHGNPFVRTILWARRDLWEASYKTTQAPGREARDVSDMRIP